MGNAEPRLERLKWGALSIGSFFARRCRKPTWRCQSVSYALKVFDVERLPDLPYAAVLAELAVFDKYQEIATSDEVLFSGVEVKNV